MDKLEVAKILKSMTFLLAKMRFQSSSASTIETLNSLKCSLNEDINLWSYQNFLILFQDNNPYGGYNQLVESLNIINSNIFETDNVDEITRMTQLMSIVCEDAIKLYKEEKFKQLSDLLDVLHGLPEALISKDRWDPKIFWNVYFNPYKKRWNTDYFKIYKNKYFYNKGAEYNV
ncbi:hypothetical protein [Clostridium cellulovorans]|uniref:Uncharacterized protein n=1 Tax=Clostridium cellulovorans (strain ATCC 35296 / DSM 3052 / OCM 3 / 743B) TaxID=573061 RepID=D9SP65_CLOC7|nr:hypothetical protein [Clostridium cellulovorans]ADL52030.1 hypothetical protein Clocel_2304 [Clostridium cellulovorans 743B]